MKMIQKKMKLRDRFWQWGHTEGRYNHCYGIEEESRMTPMEGCLYFGVPNTFMVPVAEEVNKRQYNKSFKTFEEESQANKIFFFRCNIC